MDAHESTILRVLILTLCSLCHLIYPEPTWANKKAYSSQDRLYRIYWKNGPTKHTWLVISTPLKNMKVSWDHEIPMVPVTTNQIHFTKQHWRGIERKPAGENVMVLTCLYFTTVYRYSIVNYRNFLKSTSWKNQHFFSSTEKKSSGNQTCQWKTLHLKSPLGDFRLPCLPFIIVGHEVEPYTAANEHCMYIYIHQNIWCILYIHIIL
jgi:hypothetical protein